MSQGFRKKMSCHIDHIAAEETRSQLQITVIAVLSLLFSLVWATTAGAISPVISQGEFLQHLEPNESPLIVDIQSPVEYKASHIPEVIILLYDQENQPGKILACKSPELTPYRGTGSRANVADSTINRVRFYGNPGFDRSHEPVAHWWLATGHRALIPAHEQIE